jgi:hypothetical protein
MVGYNVKWIMRIISGITIFMLSIVSTPIYAEEKPDILAQLGHTSDINAVAVSPDGRFALSGSEGRIPS